MATDNQIENTAQNALNKTKQTVERAAQPLKKAGKGLGRKAGRAVGKAASKIGRAAVKLGVKAAKLFGQAVVKLLVTAGPYLLAILVVVILVAAAFNWLQDERGSSGQISMDPSVENPTTLQADGHLTADALTEPQAVIDAYYKYMSCDSFEKVFVTAAGGVKRLRFSNPNQTADFAGLTDACGLENKFYLSSAFIQMADELLNDQEFYFPEQIIKPVFCDVLPLKSDTSKKYVTSLPLVNDESENARALRTALDNNTSLTGAYAVETSLYPNHSIWGSTGTYASGGHGSALSLEDAIRRKEPADKRLLACSKVYEEAEVTLCDENGTAFLQSDGTPVIVTRLKNQGTSKVPGVWDYGFGSVLQYEAMEKDKYLSVNSITVQIHRHVETLDMVDRRYNKEGHYNMVFTSNKNPSLWRENFNEDGSLLCALDRIFDDATVFNIKGESFRGKGLETVSLQTGMVHSAAPGLAAKNI